MTAEDNKTKSRKVDGFIPDQVEFQLKVITKSPVFKSSLQMQNFLGYIVRKKLVGQESLLKQYTIAVDALGQAEDFDAETNPLIRIEAGRLRKKLAEYYKTDGKYDFCIISIPVGRYVPKFEKNPYNTEIPETNTSRLVTSNGWKQSCGPRLLVSCFTDQIQGDESFKTLYYITDNLARELSRFSLFQLISAIPHADKKISSSVIDSYRDNNKTDYILTVHIHHIKEKKYQLVTQLIEIESQEILWSEIYTLLAQELDKQQDEICNKITAEVVDLLQGVMHVHWARKLLQQGKESIDGRFRVLAFYRYYSDNLTNESFSVAVKACQQAIKNDPEDVIAHIVYCEYCRQEYVYLRGVIENPLEDGLKSGQQAVRLKPDSHEAHYVLGQIWFHLGNKKLSILAFEQSRRLSQHNPQISFGYGFHLFFMERWDEAMQLVDKVMASKSSYPDWYHMLPFLNFYRLGRYDEGLIQALQIVSPGVFWGPLARAVSYGQLNKPELAKKELDELVSRYPDFEKNGLKMLERYFSNKLLFDKVFEGLEKAGMTFDKQKM